MLREGHQAVLAVPLRHGETVHGVLVVVASDPTIFGESAQTVLAELGRSIGNEMTALDRQQALESDTTTELEFDVYDDDLPFVELSAVMDCRMEFERVIRQSADEISTFYSIDGAAPGTVAERAAKLADVTAARVISDGKSDVGLVKVTTESWFGTPVTERGAIFRDAWASDGEGRLVVEVPHATETRTVVEQLGAVYPAVELRAQRERERSVRTILELQDTLESRLTDRQLETLKTAYSAGYFAWPRDGSAEEIAQLLGITQPTFNNHLRTAERKTFAMLLDREFPDDE